MDILKNWVIQQFKLWKITLFNISDKYPAVFNVGYIGLLILGVLFMLGAYLLPKKY